ncbi:MAG: rRNA maturation RNase YbeY [Rhizobiaceae bacterium]|nr:rRNA maturation RNase YbeY [Rhizobiaceae bacterium]
MNAQAHADRLSDLGSILIEIEAGDWPTRAELEAIASRAIAATFAEAGIVPVSAAELGITFTDDTHMAALNGEWRGKSQPTNVLSFPLAVVRPGDPLPPLLGDIVLGFETVEREAREQGKPFTDHLTHLIVHGLLHLFGHDHMMEVEAEAMEALERRVLERLAIPDPYA